MSWYFFHCSHKRGTLWGGVPRGSRHRQLLPAVFHHHLHLLEIQVGTQANHVFAVWLSSGLLPRQVSQKLTDVSKVRTNSITAMETRLQDATSQKTFIFYFFKLFLILITHLLLHLTICRFPIRYFSLHSYGGLFGTYLIMTCF